MIGYVTSAIYSSLSGRLALRIRSVGGVVKLVHTSKVQFVSYVEDDEDGDCVLYIGDTYDDRLERRFKQIKSVDMNGVRKEGTFGNLPSSYLSSSSSSAKDLDAQCAAGIHGCAWHRYSLDDNGYAFDLQYDETVHLELEKRYPVQLSVLYVCIRLDVRGQVIGAFMSDDSVLTSTDNDERHILCELVRALRSVDVLVYHGAWTKDSIASRCAYWLVPIERWPICLETSDDAAGSCCDVQSIYEYVGRRSCLELLGQISDIVVREQSIVLREYKDKVESRNLIETMLNISRIVGAFPGGPRTHIMSSILCREAIRRGAVFPRGERTHPVLSQDIDNSIERNGGGLVLDTVPGIHADVHVYDFKSYYPRYVVEKNIDASTMLADGSFVDRSVREGLIPCALKKLILGREAHPEHSKAYKQAANECIGCLALSGRIKLYNSITGGCREQLERLRVCAVDNGAEVLYGDTDSLFITVKETEREELESKFSHVIGVAGWQQFLHRETISRMLLTDKKKRYACLHEDGSTSTTGMFGVRADVEPLLKELDRRIVETIMTETDELTAIDKCIDALREVIVTLRDTREISRLQVRRISKRKTSTTTFKKSCSALGLYRTVPYYIKHGAVSYHPLAAACSTPTVDASNILKGLDVRCRVASQTSPLGVIVESCGGYGREKLAEVASLIEHIPIHLSPGKSDTTSLADIRGSVSFACCETTTVTTIAEEREMRRRASVFHSVQIQGNKRKLFIVRCNDALCPNMHMFCVDALKI